MPLLILSRLWGLLRAVPWQVYVGAVLVIAGMVYIHRQREDAATDAVREIREDQGDVIEKAKERAAPGPVRDADDFLDCLQHGKGGCF